MMHRIEMGPFWSVQIDICTKEKDFLEYMEYFKETPAAAWVNQDSGASIWTFKDRLMAVICLDANGWSARDTNLDHIAGCIAHEATHAMQFLASCIHNTEKLSYETEAYIVQHVTAHAFRAIGREEE